MVHNSGSNVLPESLSLLPMVPYGMEGGEVCQSGLHFGRVRVGEAGSSPKPTTSLGTHDERDLSVCVWYVWYHLHLTELFGRP